MKPLYFLFFLLSICPGFSLAQYFKVDLYKGDSPYNQEVSFKFPHLVNPDNPAAADSITRDLIRDVLLIEPGTQKRSIFENVWGSKPLDLPTVGDISFKVKNNDSDFFCIGISATTCTTSCHDWTRYYTRESATGRKIRLEELFTPAGIQNLLYKVKLMKEQRINEYIIRLQAALDTALLANDDKRDYASSISIYKKYLQTPDSIAVGQLRFSVDKKNVTIYMDRILPFAYHYIDKINYSFPVEVSGLRNFMTVYALSLFKP
jgi:hypothetical protein